MRAALSLTKRSIIDVRPLAKNFQGVLKLPSLILFTLWWRPVCLWEGTIIKVFLAVCQEVALGEGGLALAKGLHNGLLQRGALKRPLSPDLDHDVD